MNSIVFIETHKSGSSYDAITAAKNMDYYTILVTDIRSRLTKKAEFSSIDLMVFCDLSDLDMIKNEIDNLLINDLTICAIVSFVEESCYTASLLAMKYNLVYFTPEAIMIMIDKLKTRKAISGTPYSPYYYEIKNRDDFNGRDIVKRFPLILKEPMSSASRSVIKVNNYPEFVNVLKKFKSQFPYEPLLLEEYLDGPQFLVETIVLDSNVHIAAIIKQEISYAYKFIVTGYKIILDHENEFMQSLISAVKDIIKTIGMSIGPCHLEMRYACGQWKLIEANPRISGASMNELIETAYGINLVKETLMVSLGQKPDLTPKHKQEAFAQYIIVKKEGILLKVTGRNSALKCSGVTRVYIKPRKGQLLIPPLSMGNRYAYVIATGNTADEAMTNAKFAAKLIKFFLKEIDGEILNKLSIEQRDTLNEYYEHRSKFTESVSLEAI